MSSDYNQIFLISIILHSAILIVIAILLRRSKNRRTKILWNLAIANTIIFPIGILVASYIQSPISLLTTLAYVAYSLIVAFVLGIEIPGFLLLSKFDGKLVESLEDLRKDLVIMGYSFDHLAKLKTTASTNKEMLSSAQLDTLINDFIGSCERMKNLDKTSWSIALAEVTSSIKTFSERSKHPFPKLIDILSLAGLSFLLAQFLKLLG